MFPTPQTTLQQHLHFIIQQGKMDTLEKVKEALDKIRPALQADRGGIELVSVEGDVVKVKFQGACAGCPMSQMTLKGFVEDVIKKTAPEINKVEAV